MFLALRTTRIKTSLAILALILLLVLSIGHLVVGQQSSTTLLQAPPSGIAWVTEPLQQVYNQIQNRFIGLIPGNYTEPGSSDYSTMGSVFSLINTGIIRSDSGQIMNAANLAAQENYQLVPVNDTSTGNKYFVLMESLTQNRGWGSYLFPAERGANPTLVIVEAPHPVTDANSQQIAFSIFTSTYPRVTALLVSGVERTLGLGGQTDMAHRSQSIFETAHETLTSFGSVVIQIHGFSSVSHPTEPMVVLSEGDGGLNGALRSIATSLDAAGMSVGIFDGFQHELLGAQDNVQGRYARSFGAGFVHAEISSFVVYNGTLVSQFENGVSQSIMNGFRFPAYPIDLKIPAISIGIMCVFFLASFRFSRTKAKI